LTRYQVINCYMGRAGRINSGGARTGESDLADGIDNQFIVLRRGRKNYCLVRIAW
jgi:fructose-bisphosphate aldolase, class I